ncbi:MAG: diphthamide synthesis protein [Candidatus Altarchaeaceae archaeon]
MEILYVPGYYKNKIDENLKEELLKFVENYNDIGIVYVIQHEKNAYELKNFIEKFKKNVIIGGKILGCNIENAKRIENFVDVFIFIASGKFHSINLAANVNKKVVVFDVISKEIKEISKDEIKKFKEKKISRILKFYYAKKIGIVVSLKTYQNNIIKAFELKEKFEKEGKKAFILVGNEINYSNLLGIEVDAFVNTACPRLVEDEFPKTIVNIDELEL